MRSIPVFRDNVGSGSTGGGGGSSGNNLLVFDWNKVITEADRGFPRNDPPMASANGNWFTPINYAEGTFHIRAQIRSQATVKDNNLQLSGSTSFRWKPLPRR